MKDKKPIRREFSAGGVVYKKQGSKILWLVGKHSGYHKWVLPKGLIEKGEKASDAAVREVEEEMGIKAKLMVKEKPVKVEEYWYQAKLKTKNEKRKTDRSNRRVVEYQENLTEKEKQQAAKVFKTVKFFLMEYVSGEIKDKSWEMKEAGWFEFDEALGKLAFEGEKKTLRQARDKITS